MSERIRGFKDQNSDRVIMDLLDNRAELAKLDQQATTLKERRARLVVKAASVGLADEPVMLATGLSRSSLWRTRRQAEAGSTPERVWDIRAADGGAVEAVGQGVLAGQLRDLLLGRFDALGEVDFPADIEDRSSMTRDQRIFMDEVDRLVLEASATDQPDVESEALGVTLHRARDDER